MVETFTRRKDRREQYYAGVVSFEIEYIEMKIVKWKWKEKKWSGVECSAWGI